MRRFKVGDKVTLKSLGELRQLEATGVDIVIPSKEEIEEWINENGEVWTIKSFCTWDKNRYSFDIPRHGYHDLWFNPAENDEVL